MTSTAIRMVIPATTQPTIAPVLIPFDSGTFTDIGGDEDDELVGLVTGSADVELVDDVVSDMGAASNVFGILMALGVPQHVVEFFPQHQVSESAVPSQGVTGVCPN